MSEWKQGRSGGVQARLFTEFEEVEPLQDRIWLALELELEPGWYSYWKNPGDVGLPPRIDWRLPTGWKADPIQYWIPQRHPAPGELELTSFGYRDRVIYLILLSGPEVEEEVFRISAALDFLVCEELCVPERMAFELNIPVGTEIRDDSLALEIEEAFLQLPKETEDFAVRWRGSTEFELSLFGVTAEDLFFYSPGLRANFWKAEEIGAEADREVWRVRLDEPVQSLEFVSSYGLGLATTGVTGKIQSRGLSFLEASFWLAILFAFLGGVILNLMPCVLPVVVLKTNSVLRLRAENRDISPSLILTIAGVLFSFLVLALFTGLLKSLGQQVGWGFQFQSPGFVSFMILVIFLFALNLWGLFDVQLSSKLGSRLSSKTGPFFEGVFATILATPCSAPFLGAALTFALSQSFPVLVLFFLVMGLGLALPYVLLLVAPDLLGFLPKPGPWMLRLKRILAYSLLLAVLWLAYVLNQQTASIVLFALGLGFLLIVVCLKEFRSGWRWALVVLICLGGVFASERFSLDQLQQRAAIEQRIQTFDEREFRNLLEEGELVFLNITADWCLTCKYNEATVLKTGWFLELLEENGVIFMEADWTRRDATIGRFLEAYGRVGIPFSGFFAQDETELLPELVTRGIADRGLQEILQRLAQEPESED